MSYDPPPDCQNCHHHATVHRDWWKDRPKECVTYRNGVRCECRAYVRSAT